MLALKENQGTPYQDVAVLSHLKPATEGAGAVPGHPPPLGIENGPHWVLDIAFREDDRRVCRGHAYENPAVLRHMALDLPKQETSLKLEGKNNHVSAA